MSKASAGRLAASAAAVMILAGTGVAAGAGAAVAAPAAQTVPATQTAAASSSHSVTYTCKIPVLGNQAVPTKLTLSAPAKATVGKTVKVSVSFKPAGLPSVTVTKVTLKSTLTESGAQKGSVAVKAFIKTANAATVKATLSGRVKLAKRGKVNFTPGPSATFTVTNSILGTVTFTCKANTKKLPVLGTITVGKAAKAPVRAARLG